MKYNLPLLLTTTTPPSPEWLTSTLSLDKPDETSARVLEKNGFLAPGDPFYPHSVVF